MVKERRNQIEAIFITHGHEDHVGAVGHLWGDLGAPIYARAFTAHLARHKMSDHGHSEQSVKTVSNGLKPLQVGPFTVGFLPISHSIPESSALVIDTPVGRIVHTGDFKLDTNPVVGEAFDEDLWAEVAKDGVHALVCDSTNVFSDHAGRSESTLGTDIQSLIRSGP